MTSEQRDFLTILMNNKTVLEELLKVASIKQKQAKDLQMNESITVTGITWSKFAEDSEGNAYMLADKNIYVMRFGKNNNWGESLIREKMNNELYQKISVELGVDALVPIQTDLFSNDGLRDYENCEDMITLLTYDLYRNNRENIKNSKEYFWTCTPYSTPSGDDSSSVLSVDDSGVVNIDHINSINGVRPFFILKSDIFVSCESVEGGSQLPGVGISPCRDFPMSN